MLTIWALAAIALVMSFALTGAVRQVAIARQMIDVPNARSSHQVPTPRGGGIAVVVTFSAAIAWLSLAEGIVPPRVAAALLGSGGLVALIGLLDDLRPIDARWRLLCHGAAAVWGLAWLGGVTPFPAFGVMLDLGWLAQALGVLYLVGLLNFYNFMDGIDGIASLEAITVSLGGALVWWIASPVSHGVVPVVFAACVAGFLAWNLPPAKIFMGDAGSGYIGIVLGLLSLWAGREKAPLFWAWFVLIGCFMVDASVTLLRRLRRGTRFDQAHRSHAYQYASRKLGAHGPVSIAYAAITALWLLPWAAAVAAGHVDGVLAVLIAYAPLVALAFRYKAGAAELQDA